MKITLSIPDDVVVNAYKYAKKHGTSLNQMVREHLKSFSQEPVRQDIAERALAFFKSIAPTIPKGTTITRDEMEQR